MKTERIIKQQARESMRGNMSVLIAAMGMVALSFLLLEYIEYLVLYFLKAVNFDTGEIIGDKKLIYYIVIAAATVLILFVSPLLNGFLRTAANAALHRESKAVDVFYFFKSPKLYFKTVLYNFLLAVLFLTVSGALNINTYLETFAPDWYHQDPAWNTDTVLKVIAGVCTLFIKLVVYMVFVHYSTFFTKSTYFYDFTILDGVCLTIFRVCTTIVKLNLAKELAGEVVLPLEDLPAFLSDPAKVEASLAPVEPTLQTGPFGWRKPQPWDLIF